jgi:hypothetical protein
MEPTFLGACVNAEAPAPNACSATRRRPANQEKERASVLAPARSRVGCRRFEASCDLL